MSDMLKDATARPWRVEDGTDLIWGDCNPEDQSTYGMGYSIVLGQYKGWAKGPDMDEREANARLIVTAVNAYEPMLDALEVLEEMVDAVTHADSETILKTPWMYRMTGNRLTKAREAIAIAKVETS